MKKCPSCDKTFEDSMRFCQVDGTPLVDEAPAFDPYATMVAPAGLANAVADGESAKSEAATQIAEFPVHDQPIAEPEDVLEMPVADPLKTMYVSEAEMREALGATESAEEPLIELSPLAEPEPPAFLAPEMTPPPSPFSPPPAEPSIPSPFDYSSSVAEIAPIETSPYSSREPTYDPPPFKEPEPAFTPVVNTPFEQSSSPAEWTPPPAPDASWQNQEIGSNTPFQPPPAGTSGENKVLPIVSLVLGILSICCYVSPITGIAALITGFLGMKNANAQPDLYGGKGLAIAGMITGGVFLLIGLLYWIFILFFGGMAMIMNGAR